MSDPDRPRGRARAVANEQGSEPPRRPRNGNGNGGNGHGNGGNGHGNGGNGHGRDRTASRDTGDRSFRDDRERLGRNDRPDRPPERPERSSRSEREEEGICPKRIKVEPHDTFISEPSTSRMGSESHSTRNHPGRGGDPGRGDHPGRGGDPGRGDHPGRGGDPGRGDHPGRGGDLGRGSHPGQGHSSGHKQSDVKPTLLKLEGLEGGGRGRGRGRSRDDLEIVKCRPEHVQDKRGTVGVAIQLVANYFPLQSTPNWAMYHYHVDFCPNIEGARIRRALVQAHAKTLRSYIFDGMALFTVQRLEIDELELYSERKSDGEKIKITMKLARELQPKDPVVLQICNIQMRRNMRYMRFQQLGRHYFDAHDAISIPNHNLELWPGFTTAIHRFETRVMMCTDMAFKVLRSDSVLDQLRHFYNQSRGSGNFQGDAEKELIGNIVLTRYNNKTYRVDSIEWNMHPTDTFQLKDGSTVSFIDYYQKTWSLPINDRLQPMLVSNPKKRDIARGMSGSIILIPELCIMTGISEATRTNFAIMKDLAVHTKKDPNARVQVLKQFMSRIISNQQIREDMSGWSLEFDQNLVNIDGRHLPAESIIQSDGQKISYNPCTADWSREMRGNHLINVRELRRWALLSTSRDSNVAREFLNTLRRVGPPMGINISQPQMVPVSSDRPGDYIGALQSVARNGMELVVCVVPNNRKDRYDAIKKQCCIDTPVASQVIVARTLTKQQTLMSITTKIAIQLNCKLGGAAWTVELPLKNVMVIGYDSYHDSSQRGRTVGGFCCSMNKTLTQWYSRVTFQTTHEEMVEGFQTNIGEATRRYHQLNGTMPDRVFVFRDGVSEGQLQAVKDFELGQVQEVFKSQFVNYSPKLAFIVVNKRVNTRIMQRQGPRQLCNPQPGTVVDSEITRPEWYDFFLVSQSVKQGTVSPTQYNVIHDTSGLRPDHIQRLTYKLTHLYYNWQGTVTVPAPCMYAHKLAFLTGQSLHGVPHLALADTLFYL